MIQLLEFRVSKLAHMSEHYRDLAAALYPEMVSAEVDAAADRLDEEVARLRRECVGRRTCPCEFISACVALNDDGAVFEARDSKA
jgi:hypothetical protein